MMIAAANLLAISMECWALWFPACMTARIWAAMLAIYTSSQVGAWELRSGGDGRHVVFAGREE